MVTFCFQHQDDVGREHYRADEGSGSGSTLGVSQIEWLIRIVREELIGLVGAP